MTARKKRPALGAPVTEGMSLRDMAASIGVSKAELCRWQRLAEIPAPQFEKVLADAIPRGARSAASIISEYEKTAGIPVPARGRVARAKEACKSMTPAELAAFSEWLAKGMP